MVCCGQLLQIGEEIKTDEKIRKYIYNLILQNPQVLKSPIFNDCLKVYIDGQSEPELFPKWLLQVSVCELHNRMVSPPEEGGIKEAIYTDSNIIISDSTLRSIIPPQLKKVYEQYKVMCGCEYFISAKNNHSSLLSWRDSYLRNLNDLIQNSQNRRSGERANCLFETYNNSVMPHGRHIYATSDDMDMATICAYPPSQHALPH